MSPKKFEYRYRTFTARSSSFGTLLETSLNLQGQDGWEVVSYNEKEVPQFTDTVFVITILSKKEII